MPLGPISLCCAGRTRTNTLTLDWLIHLTYMHNYSIVRIKARLLLSSKSLRGHRMKTSLIISKVSLFRRKLSMTYVCQGGRYSRARVQDEYRTSTRVLYSYDRSTNLGSRCEVRLTHTQHTHIDRHPCTVRGGTVLVRTLTYSYECTAAHL